MTTLRLKRLYEYIEQEQLAAVAVNAGPTLTYLTGLHFHLMERPVVIVFAPGQEPTMILPKLELAKLDALQWSARVFSYADNPEYWGDTFRDALKEAGLDGGRVGVEPRQMRVMEYEYLRGALGAQYVDGSPVFTALRAVKDAAEIADMRQAVQIAEQALEATLPMVKTGVTEKEIASELFIQLMKHGSGPDLPFNPIVAAGPNGAKPHSEPSDRPLAEGDLLIVDWGASYNGYASDLTRTFAVGRIDKEAEEIHKIVQAANQAGRDAAAAGVPCAEVDKATREVIVDAGFGDFFPHRTGHGIGMECHEEPYMHGENGQLLEVGHAFTVEPGIYLKGRNGVRIEDDVVITENGAESLSTMARELRVLG